MTVCTIWFIQFKSQSMSKESESLAGRVVENHAFSFSKILSNYRKSGVRSSVWQEGHSLIQETQNITSKKWVLHCTILMFYLYMYIKLI